MGASIEMWVEYLLRFSHLVAGIAWIGSSFYFIWLDGAFEPPTVPRKNVEGELFMVHGGFYYQVEKKKIYPGELPKVLHWFKWEATLTWVTGFMLLIALYYLRGASFLVDPNVHPMSQGRAVLLSLGIIFFSTAIYDMFWSEKIIRNKTVSAFLTIPFFIALIYMNTRFFSGRGAFIQTGAMFGTMMLFNVGHRILPGQRKMIKEAEAGQIPDYSVSLKAKTRSVHNTYFIFPVLFIMLSNHYSSVYMHSYNWLLLIILSVAGACTRHAMVTKVAAQRWTLIPAIIALLGLVYMTGAPKPAVPEKMVQTTGPEPVTFAQVHAVFQQRCLTCHSSHPTDDIFKVTPKSVVLETEEQMKANAQLIYQQVVVSKTMPFINKTQITEDERALIGRWVEGL